MSEAKQWSRQAEAEPPKTPRRRPKAEPEEAEDPVAEIDLRQVLSRARLLIIVFLAVISVIIFRLVAWSMSPSPAPVEPYQTVDNSRGRIVDSDGLLLATDNYLWDVYVRISALKQLKNRSALPAELAVILGVTEAELRGQLSGANDDMIIVARDVSDDQCKAIAGLNALNVTWCDYRLFRVYPQNGLGAHLIGFANMDQEGKTGTEHAYDSWLHASERAPFQQMPGRIEALPDAWQVYLPSGSGRDLVLHMNAPLQHKVEQRLRDAITTYQAESGCIIVMDPHTGGILALANWPTYDLNNYGRTQQAVMRNSAVEDIYEPGSVFKIVTYAAALDEGAITPEMIFNDTGKLDVEGKVVQNAEKRKYGKVTTTRALEKSINTVSARIALDLGGEKFYRYINLFGFGKRSEADVVNESGGVVPRWGTDAWNRRDQASNSFGQAISVTPLQMASAVATIANGGVVLQPQVVAGVVKDGQVNWLDRRVMDHAIRPETAKTLTRMMVSVAESYSVKNLAPGFRVAGKTGTAEIAEQGGYTSNLTITSFSGFLPAADPKVVILVKLDKPKKSKWAEAVALPVFQQVALDAVKILKIEPNDQLP